MKMVVRARRKCPDGGSNDYKEDFSAAEGLLAGTKSYARRVRRKRTWYQFCVFCSVGGLSVM